jgi:flagellar biosynthetic protein FliS
MLAHHAYRRHREVGTTRIELVLSLYDQAIERLGRAESLLAEDSESLLARTLIAQAQTIVTGMASGIVAKDELSVNFARLYEFVGHRLTQPSAKNVRDAVKVLGTLREAFESVREAATRLEREGSIPPMDVVPNVQATA